MVLRSCGAVSRGSAAAGGDGRVGGRAPGADGRDDLAGADCGDRQRLRGDGCGGPVGRSASPRVRGAVAPGAGGPGGTGETVVADDAGAPRTAADAHGA